jgi:uncharacterized protein YacL
MNFETMSKQRKYVLIAAAIGVVSLFLPWVKVSFFGATGSVNAMNGSSGYFVLALFVVSGIMAYRGNQNNNIDKKSWIVILICSIVATLWLLLIWLGASNSNNGTSLAYGYYLSLLSAIGVVVAAFIFRSPADNIKDGFNSLKNDINARINSGSSGSSTTHEENKPNQGL